MTNGQMRDQCSTLHRQSQEPCTFGLKPCSPKEQIAKLISSATLFLIQGLFTRPKVNPAKFFFSGTC